MNEISILNPVDFRTLERSACAKARGARVEESWDELTSQARELLDNFLAQAPENASDYYDQSQTLPLIAVARILDTAAQWQPAHDKSEREALKQMGLLAALCFGAAGNFPSAGAVLRRTFPTLRPHSTAQALFMAVAAPAMLDEIQHPDGSDDVVSQFFDLFTAFLQSSEGDETVIRAAWQNAISDDNGVMACIGKLCIEQAFTLSSARILQESSALPADYVARLAKQVPLLMPPQWQAVNAGLLEPGNALIALPPGTGKTLLGELCLMAALGEKPGLAVFLAPYVALGRQVARTLEAHLPANIRVRRHLGGGEVQAIQPQERAEVLVATPEKLDGLLRTQPHLREHLKIVVCDEAHLIGGNTRGARLEGLLTRLRLQQEAGHSLRLVLLSAALSESTVLREWMQLRVFASDWRPTARRVALWTNDGKLTWRGDEDFESGAFALPLPWPQPHITPTDHWPAVERQTPLIHMNAAYAAKHLNETLGGAVLCVCATRRGTRRMAQALAQVFTPREPHGTLSQAIEIIEKRHRVLWPLADALRCGVAWHNSSLPHEVRSLIEEAIESGELEVVASTTTLAEGADFPFRATILVDWLHWDETGQHPLAPQLFRNIAGRCGRAGAFTEGDTIIVDNPLGDLAFTAPDVRRRVQKQAFFADLPAEPDSTFEKLNEETPSSAYLHATLASQFVAAIAENQGSADLEQRFLSHSYAVRRGAPLQAALQNIAQALLEGGFAEHTKAGIWQLSDLGHAANESELSPATCRLLLGALCDLKSAALPAGAGRIAFIGAHLLRAVGACPEQSHTDLKNVLTSKRSRFCVKPGDFEMVLQLWLRGEGPAAIFRELPFARRSARQIDVEEWVEGEAGRDEAAAGWQNELDKFVDFSRHVLEVFLPWILRACERLAPFQEAEGLLDWQRAAQWMEAGVDSDWAIKILEKNAPGTRKSLAALGRNPQNFDAALKEVGGKYCDAGQDLLATVEWLHHPSTHSNQPLALKKRK